MELYLVGIIGIVIMVILLLLGVNIGMSMFLIGFIGYAYCIDLDVAFQLFMSVPFTQAASFSLSVIPLFVLMGQFAFRSGITTGLFDFAKKWGSKLPGSLAIATIIAAAFFSAICGSTIATTATFVTVALPEMRKAGYDDGLSTGSIVAGGTLGVLIPPSTVFIVYGLVAEESIGKLFASGIIPGILLAICYCAAVVLITKLHKGSTPANQVYSWKERLLSLKGIGPTAVLFIAVIGGMFLGVFTANEAAAIGAAIGLLFLVFNKTFSFRAVAQCLVDSLKTTAMIFQVILGAYVFNYFLTVTELPQFLAEWVGGLPINRYFIVIVIVLIFFVLGCIMDSLAIILLTVPIFLPIIKGLGFDPIWYGVLMVLAQDQGLMTPPVGLNVYIVSGMVRDIPMQKIFKGTMPFVAAIFFCILLVIFFPQLSLWLPSIIS
jgi:tripartite ATP-independent transporter DctM subunit